MTNKIKISRKESDLDNLPTIDDVSPFKEILYEKLDSAILATRTHFDESKHRHDVPGFFAKHVRAKLQDLLEPEAENYTFSIDTSQGSFLIAYKNFLIRFYKAYNGMLPFPNRDSKSQLRFFNHNGSFIPWPQPLPGFETMAGISVVTRIHLIAYYDVSPRYDLSWLKIACPVAVSSCGVNCVWNELVENPLLRGNIPLKDHPRATRPDISFTLLQEDNDEASGLG
jgi:hypothetical protein